jgi:ABC-type multidrug transport system fused ATPase/permease subunit
VVSLGLAVAAYDQQISPVMRSSGLNEMFDNYSQILALLKNELHSEETIRLAGTLKPGYFIEKMLITILLSSLAVMVVTIFGAIADQKYSGYTCKVEWLYYLTLSFSAVSICSVYAASFLLLVQAGRRLLSPISHYVLTSERLFEIVRNRIREVAPQADVIQERDQAEITLRCTGETLIKLGSVKEFANYAKHSAD